MDAGLFNMFHDPPDEHLFPVADRINVKFDSILQIGIDQDRVMPAHPHCLFHVGLQFDGVMDDLHRPPSKDIGWPDKDRVPDSFRFFFGFGLGIGRTVGGLGICRVSSRMLNRSRSSAISIASGTGSQHSCERPEPFDLLFKRYGKVNRILAAKLDHHPVIRYPS